MRSQPLLLSTLALLGAGPLTATAQSTTSMLLFWNPTSTIYASIITAVPSTTLFALSCGDPSAEDCAHATPITATLGPSSIAYTDITDDEERHEHEEFRLGCEWKGTTSAACTATDMISDTRYSTSDSYVTSTTIQGPEVAGVWVKVVVTAGLEKVGREPAETGAVVTGSGSATESATAEATSEVTSAPLGTSVPAGVFRGPPATGSLTATTSAAGAAGTGSATTGAASPQQTGASNRGTVAGGLVLGAIVFGLSVVV